MYSSRKANLMLLTFFDTAKLLLKITTTKNRASLWRKNLLTKWVLVLKKLNHIFTTNKHHIYEA